MSSVNATALARKSWSRAIKTVTVTVAAVVIGVSVGMVVLPERGAVYAVPQISGLAAPVAVPVVLVARDAGPADPAPVSLPLPMDSLLTDARPLDAPSYGGDGPASVAALEAAVDAPSPPPGPLAQATPPTSAGANPTILGPGVAVQGVSEREIRFGMAGPFSGPSRQLGAQMRVGIETAFRVANDAGGVNGRKLVLAVADDGYDPARTQEAMRQLLEKDQVFGFIGNVGTPTAAVALPIVLSRRMLFFGAFTGTSLLRGNPPDHTVFNFRAGYAEETAATVRYLVQTRRLRPDQIAVFAQQDGYGDAGFDGIAKAVRQLRQAGGGAGAEPGRGSAADAGLVTLRMNYRRNSVDVDEAVAQLALYQKKHATNPIRAVVMVSTYRAAAKFVERTLDQVPGLIYTNLSFVGSSSLAEELTVLGPRFAQGVIVTQVVPSIDSHARVVLDYKAALAKYAPSENADFVSFEGYLSATLLVEGLKRAGPALDTGRLVDTLEGLRDVDLGLGTPVGFTRSEHQALHRVWGTQIDAKGKFLPLDLE